jgi:ADYC domain
MRTLLFLTLMALGGTWGCAVAEDSGDRAGAEVSQKIGAADEDFNGPLILGAALEDPKYKPASSAQYFSVGTAATRGPYAEVVAFAGGASLASRGADGSLRGADPKFSNLVFAEGIRLTVLSGDSNVTHYKLDAQTSPGVFTPLCSDAIPLAGVFDTTGQHLDSPTRITLACSDGAAHKCVRFGYPPGATSGSPSWGVHQACVQAVTAAYCASEGSNTRSGTSIRFYDDAGVNQVPPGLHLPVITPALWPPGPSEYYFETAFTANHEDALCVGKLRWPLTTNTCATLLPDCPGTTVDPLLARGGVFFVASRYNQLRLDRWIKGSDHVATVRGYRGPETILPPADGYVFEGNDGVLLRVPPQSVPPPPVTEVSLFRQLSNNDRFLAKSSDARFLTPAFANEGFEGFVYNQFIPGLKSLRLYGKVNDRTATTEDAAAMTAKGYGSIPDNTGSNLIGWVAPLQ